ncbi:3182_t:CDS:2 [Funneliformis geosporum]|nr:3182_t:CDS:2 [Funneliformis geosporum]
MVNQEDINFQKEEYEKKLGTIKELLKNKEKNLEETNSELQLLNQKLIILHNSRIRRIINPAKKGKINLKIADCLKTINKLNDEISEMIKEKANILGKLEANKKVVNMEEIGGLEEVLTVINEEDQQELEEVTTNAQEYINQKYPTPKDKANCRVLDISSYHWQHNSQGRKEKLTGSLSLQGFINLKQLNCSFNQISEIDVNDCHQLEMFICSHNRLTKLDCTGLDKLRIIICTSNLLTSLDHSFLNSAKLISLSISNNSFPKQDLSVFSKFTNLQYLGIGNDNEMFNNDTYNRFYGSLDPLKSLTKLDCLEINNTDVDSGLEYLSDNIQTICCHFGFRPESKVRKIAEQLSANDLFFFDDAGIKITDADLARYLVAKATSPYGMLEWIPYEQFSDSKYLAEGGFGMSADFLQEITFHKLASGTSSFFNFIVRCFGISRDPKTNNYIMVTEYIEGGDLRKYLKEKYNRLTFRNKLNNLLSIAEGLNYIHRAKLIHKDLHAGNILNNKGKSYITDLGLCRPADEPSEGKIFGVLPYVAPEVLTGKPYTQASDVYSFGIVAHKLFSGLLPYHDIPDTELLALRIYSDPKQRPTANEIYEILKVEALQGQESDEKERLGLHAVSEVNKQFNLDKYFHSLLKQNATPLITDLEEEEIQTKVKEGQVPLEFAEFSKKDLHFQNSLNACLEFFEREWKQQQAQIEQPPK